MQEKIKQLNQIRTSILTPDDYRKWVMIRRVEQKRVAHRINILNKQ